ncbi:hypothetical protein L210DRAFT_3559220 [Boletus edulis BED1]|uniref:Uncharacterized protein n=2 Tax=Boletus edulis BED1 TaxID=1328754 RepID=A0AAD4BJD6_BOLED|nr:hypothetical protein L210DRAFT_3559220 [Boletus edulis BED1]
MVAMSIVVLAESNGAIFFNINFQLVYDISLPSSRTTHHLHPSCYRPSLFPSNANASPREQHVRPYETTAIRVVESAALYSLVDVIFIISLALHSSDISDLVFLSIGQVQASAAVFTALACFLPVM